MEDTILKYATDIIASTAFGMNGDSIEDANNEFYTMTKKLIDFSGLNALKYVSYALSPTLMKLLKVKFINEKAGLFFNNVIKNTLELRKENNIIRHDLVHLLMNAQKEGDASEGVAEATTIDTNRYVKPSLKSKQFFTEEDIHAHAVSFLFGGTHTVTTCLSYVAYELALNPDVQEKLYVEIKNKLDSCNENLSYEQLLSMKYLDNVISECLRLHPPIYIMDRQCTEPYTIESINLEEKRLDIDKGLRILIPIRSIHRDPKHFPNPEMFDPDRFNDDNKHKINRLAYIPFGSGPRTCIAVKFAQLDCKVMIVDLLKRFQLVPVEETPIPLKLNPLNANPYPKGGIMVGLVPRNKLILQNNLN